jgi:hypothetical protein
MANYVKNLPANWKRENWQGLIGIEDDMRSCAAWDVSCANTSYPPSSRNSNPAIMKLYNEVMLRASRHLAKAERVAEYRNSTYPNGEPTPEAAPHVNPKPNGDEPFILLAAAGIMEQRGIHVTARKLIDMAHDIEAELELTAKP